MVKNLLIQIITSTQIRILIDYNKFKKKWDSAKLVTTEKDYLRIDNVYYVKYFDYFISIQTKFYIIRIFRIEY